MALTARMIINDILNIASSGPTPISTRLSSRQIFYFINQTRAMLLAQSLAKKDDILDNTMQTLANVPLAVVDISNSSDIPLGCYLLKSTKKIPDTIDTDKDNSVLSVTGLDGTIITKSNLFRSKYKQFSKFTGKNPVWYLKDDYLYIVNSKGNLLTNVSLVGIFDNPEDINNFLDTNTPIFDWDSDYPLSYKLANEITNIVIQTKIIPMLKFPQDVSNDDSNLTQPQLQNK